MRIVYLLETTDLWGGVKSVLEAANRLVTAGHDVTVLSRTGPPAWFDVHCELRTVPNFAPDRIPAADVVVGTYWTTVPHAVLARSGAPVHYCQGYEGDNPESAPHRARIEAVYRLPQTRKLTIAPHLTHLLAERFGWRAREVRYAIDHDVMFCGAPRPARRPVRIGLVGPHQTAWKGIADGIAACGLAHRAGLALQLVRVTNTAPAPAELDLPFPVEWHVRVEPKRMGEIYRSLDVFAGTSWGAQEGFFMPAVEAMACGVPCVLTDIPCHRGYGPEQYALFVPPRDPVALAEAIVVAAAHEPVRAELRQHGLAAARRHDYASHVADLAAAFEDFAASAVGVSI